MSNQERVPIWMETPAGLGYVRAADHAALKAREERLREALRLWLASPQSPQAKLEGIRRVLDDPNYAERISIVARIEAQGGRF